MKEWESITKAQPGCWLRQDEMISSTQSVVTQVHLWPTFGDDSHAVYHVRIPAELCPFNI